MQTQRKRMYNLIVKLLQDNPDFRDSDRKLMWKIWEIEGYVFCGSINFQRFMLHGCTSPETITRTRRKIQETMPSLRGSTFIQEKRKLKQATKGKFIFREIIDPITNKIISYQQEKVTG